LGVNEKERDTVGVEKSPEEDRPIEDFSAAK